MLFLPGQWTLGEYDGETGNNDLPMALSFTVKLFFSSHKDICPKMPCFFVNNHWPGGKFLLNHFESDEKGGGERFLKIVFIKSKYAIFVHFIHLIYDI